MQKQVICLYGGPGTGKSTTAAELYSILKKEGKNVELVREYIKDWVWEGRVIMPGDQSYILAKQARKERILFESVDIIITDAPLWLSLIYEKLHEPEPYVSEAIIKKQVNYARSNGFVYKHFFLNRVKEYNPSGRLQTEEQAQILDGLILKMISENDLDYSKVDADKDCAKEVAMLLKRREIPEWPDRC